MPKLGPVPPPPPPVDPFKGQGAPSLGVVKHDQVSAVLPQAPKLGVVRDRAGQVVSVTPPPPEQIGVVNPVVSPAAPPPQAPPVIVGTVEDTTPVYPPPAPEQKPNLGTIVDRSITPAKSVDLDSEEPVSPVAIQPVVVDPHAPKE